MRVLATEADVTEALDALLGVDPRLAAVLAVAGTPPLRRRAAGFEGLAAVVTAQQISTLAAAAIWDRLRKAVDPFTPVQFLRTDSEALRQAGLSRPKIRSLTALAAALAEGFDLDAVAALPQQEAVSRLAALPGIGAWTAESYLLFCLGHPDVFPAGDLALQQAVMHAFGLGERPSEKQLRAIALAWSPWRGVAARLFWAYYRATSPPKTGRTGRAARRAAADQTGSA